MSDDERAQGFLQGIIEHDGKQAERSLYSDADERVAIIHTRQDVAMLVLLLGDLRQQSRRTNRLLMALLLVGVLAALAHA